MLAKIKEKFKSLPLKSKPSQFLKLLTREELQYFFNLPYPTNSKIENIYRVLFNDGKCKCCDNYGKYKGLWYDINYPFSCCSKKCADILTAKKITEIRHNESKEDLEIRAKKSHKTKLTNIDENGLNSYERAVYNSKQTKLERYNDENYCNVEASKQTKLERYNDENYCNVEKIKKTKLTNIDENGLNSYEVTQIKHNKTMLKRYNTIHALQVPEFLQKAQQTNKQKYGNWFNAKHLKNMNNFNKMFIIDKFGDLDSFQFRECAEYFNFHDLPNFKIKLKSIGIDYKHKQTLIHQEICIFLDSINIDYQENVKILKINDISKYNLEIDIYVPEYNFGIEINGMYWHSWNFNRDINYHKRKTDLAEQQNIQLLHIFEAQWWDDDKREIIKSMIKNSLNKIQNKIFARKCIIKEVINNTESTNFLISNHIQGKVGANIKLGLYYNNELVSMMTFINRKNDIIELNRFCSKINHVVVGGFSKLFKYFQMNYDFSTIISFSDRTYSTGNIYEKYFEEDLTFKTSPSYFYYYKNTLYHRSSFMKAKIKKRFNIIEDIDNITETELILKYKILRIYDSGKRKYILKNKRRN